MGAGRHHLYLRFRRSPALLASIVEVKLPDLTRPRLLAHSDGDILPSVALPRVQAEQGAVVLQLPLRTQRPALVLVFLVTRCHADFALEDRF